MFAVVNNRVSKDRDHTTIGRGHDATYTWITEPNNHDRLAPIGSVGELCLEGRLLAREYINNEEKTSAAFIKNPGFLKIVDNGTQGRRIYKTGDLVRYNQDGSIFFIGRKDNQVKLHGQRMELGEIEVRLEVNPSIKHVFVSLPKSGLCQKRLVAVVSVKDLPGAPSALDTSSCSLINKGQRLDLARSKVAKARELLAEQLPGYMVPSIWVLVESLPILVSGKLDRKQTTTWLEKMDEQMYKSIISADEESEAAAPQTATAQVLREVWAEVFDMPVASIKFTESFLSLGGDSISAMRVMAKCRKQGIDLSLQDILRCKSVAHLASTVGDHVSGSAAITLPDEVLEQAFDLSPIQKLFFESVGGKNGSAQFNQSYLLEINTTVDTELVEEALKALVNKHSMLRARFQKSSGGLWQQRLTKDVASSYRFGTHKVSDQQSITPMIASSQGSMDI